MAAGALALFLAGGAPSSPLPRNDGFRLSGSVRLRYEDVRGQLRPGFARDADLFSARTTVRADYIHGATHAVAELYDSRAYGDDRRGLVTTGEVNALELVQAFVGTDVALGGGGRVTLDAGRMMLNIGSRRLVAADDYRNTTNSYTGLRAGVTAPGGWNAALIYVLPQERRPDSREALHDNEVAVDRESTRLRLWGGTVSRARTLGPLAVEASYYRLDEKAAERRPNRRRALDTYGGRLFRDPKRGAWDGEMEAFRQTGSIAASIAPGAARLPVRAWFVHADVGYTFDLAWQPRLSLEYDQASGDGPGRRYGRFDTLFGMRRADLAPSGIFAAVARANILTPGVRLEAAPTRRLDMFLSWRPMWLESRRDAFSTSGVRDPAGRSGRYAGQQWDARARYWLVPDRLRAEIDGVVVARGRFLRDAPNATSGNPTTYVSLNLTASF